MLYTYIITCGVKNSACLCTSVCSSVSWISLYQKYHWKEELSFTLLPRTRLSVPGWSIAPNFRGTIYLREFCDLTSHHKKFPRKFSIIVGGATFCVHMRIAIVRAYTCDTSERMNCLKRSVELLLRMCRLYTYFQKTSKSCLPSLNNLLLVSNPPTTTVFSLAYLKHVPTEYPLKWE